MLTNHREEALHLLRNGPSAYLDRPRLYGQALYQPPRVLLLLGLKGSGKTVAAHHYLAHFSCSTLVVELQPNKQDIWSALPAALADLGLPTAHPRAAILSINEPTIVMIDRLEVDLDESGTPSTVTESWLSLLLNHPFLYVVLCSRIFPMCDDLLALAACGQIQIVNGETLAFTPPEVQTLWHARQGTDLAPQLAETLVARSGGLAALVALSCTTGIPPEDSRSLQDVLVAQILDSLPGDVHELLADIAVLETVTPAVLETFSGQPDGMQLLHSLHHHGVLTSQVPPQVHPLIRQALLERLRIQRCRFVQVTRRAINLALAEGAYQRAWQLAADAELWDCACDVIVMVAPTLRQQGASSMVATWIHNLPVQQRDHEMMEILAQCQEDVGDLDGALLTLTSLRAAATDLEKQREYTIWLANIHLSRGEINTAHPLIQPYLADESLPPRWRAHVCRIHAIAQALAGEVDDAQTYIQHSIRAATVLHDRHLLARLYQDQATIAGRIGRLGEAEHALRLAERCWRELDNPPALAGTLNARAMLTLALHDYAGAAALAQQARAHALAGGRLHTAAIASATCGDVALAQGQYAEAMLHYQVATDDAEQSGDFATRAYSLALQTHSARLHGDTGRAAELLPRLLAHAAESVEDAGWLATGVVATQLTLGEVPAIHELQRALDAVGSTTEEVRVALLIILAQAYWQVGQQKEALATWVTLEDHVQHAGGSAFQRLAPLATADPAMLNAAIAPGPAPFAQAARALLAARLHPMAPLAQRSPFRTLQIRVLGMEQVWWEGQPFMLSDRGLLLLILLLTAPGPVAEQEVLDSIWGEGNVAVHALRKLVVRLCAVMPGVIRRSAGHYAVTLPRNDIDLDLWHVLELDLQTASTDYLVALASAASAGCLTMVDAPWAVELCRRVNRRLALIWLEIGYRGEAGDPQAQAYDAFERAQQADPSSDLVTRAVLRQAQRIGDRALLIRRYLRYQEALDVALGIEPATDLQTLYLQALEP